MLLLLLLLLAPDSLSSDANDVPLFVHDLSITVNVDGVDKKVYLAPGVDPETAAQQFCEEHNVSPREPCVHGIVAELSQITQRAFGAARAELRIEGRRQFFIGEIGEDPSSTAWRCCRSLAPESIDSLHQCVDLAAPVLWTNFVHVHYERAKQRLHHLDAEGKSHNAELFGQSEYQATIRSRHSICPDCSMDDRVEMLGSVSALRSAVRLHTPPFGIGFLGAGNLTMRAFFHEALGLAELVANHPEIAMQRFLDALRLLRFGVHNESTYTAIEKVVSEHVGAERGSTLWRLLAYLNVAAAAASANKLRYSGNSVSLLVPPLASEVDVFKMLAAKEALGTKKRHWGDCSEFPKENGHKRRRMLRITFEELQNHLRQEKQYPDTKKNEALNGREPYILTGAMNEWDCETTTGDCGSSDNLNQQAKYCVDEKRDFNSQLFLRLRESTLQEENIEWFPQSLTHLHHFSPLHLKLRDGLQQLERNPVGFYYHSPMTVDVTQQGSYIHWGVSEKNWAAVMNAFARPRVRTANHLMENVTEYERRLLPPIWSGQHEWMHACFKDDEHASLSDDNTTTPEWAQALRLFVGITRWFVAYIGEAGGGMFNHVDRHQTSAWQAQVRGAKRWHICSPNQGHLMYGRGGVDVFDPDYEAKPLFAEADCYDDIVNAGEMIFYPGGWWHATRTLGSASGGKYSVSLSSLVIDKNNWRATSNAFREECKGSPEKNPPPEALCRRLLERCIPHFENKFEGDPASSMEQRLK